MKKYCLIIFSLIISCFILSSCSCNQDTNELENYVSELRYELYEGKSDSYSLKAGYGYKEQEYVNDGKVGKKIYALSFKLDGKHLSEQTYILNFTYADKSYQGEFKLNPTKHSLTCDIIIEDFSCQSFTVEIGTLDTKETVTLSSIIPQGTLDYKEALSALQKNQTELVESYYDSEGNFTAEIYQRILVKDGKAYWYIGFGTGNGKLKALLINGSSGEVLAIREVF